VPGNKKPRKKHTPCRRLSLPMTFGITSEAAMFLQMSPHQCLDEMRRGDGNDRAWHTIVCRLNIGLTLAHEHFPLAKQDMVDALQAMQEVGARHDFLKQWGMSGDQLKIVGVGLSLCDDMQNTVTRREFSKAVDEVFEKAAVYD
jgi:hypothetical protein